MTDFGKFGRPELLHFGFRALDAYAQRHEGEMPAPGDAAAAEELVAIVEELGKHTAEVEGASD